MSSKDRRSNRRRLTFSAEVEEKEFDTRSKTPLASATDSDKIIHSSLSLPDRRLASSMKRSARLDKNAKRILSLLDPSVSYSSASVEKDIQYPYVPSARGGSRVASQNRSSSSSGDGGDDQGNESSSEVVEDSRHSSSRSGDEERASGGDNEHRHGRRHRRRRHSNSRPHRHQRHAENDGGVGGGVEDEDASEAVPMQRDLFAPLNREELKRKSGKMKRDVYRIDDAVNALVSRYSPSRLARSARGASLLTDIAKLQQQERMNSVLAEQVLAMRESRGARSAQMGGEGEPTHAPRRTSEKSDRLGYERSVHSRPGGNTVHRSNLALTGTGGAKYTMRASGAKQYYH